MRKDTKTDNKDTKVNEISQVGLFDITESIIPADKRLFIPCWDNKPAQTKSIITLNGVKILSTGNLSTVISRPGVGKSSICEAIIASCINKNCDSFGFSTILYGARNKILYIDTERTIGDSWNSWERINKRSDIKKPTNSDVFIFINAKAVPIKERKQYVVDILNDNTDIGLVIFDGAGDFLMDTNSIQETVEFIDWINTFNNQISILVTLHTNPTDDKPRGHIGSELCRRAESVLLLKKLDDGIREITTNFTHGKVRNDTDQVTSHYEYSEIEDMFVTCKTPPAQANPPKRSNLEKDDKDQSFIKKVFNGSPLLSASYITSQIEVEYNKSYNTAKQYFSRSIRPLLSMENGNYRQKTQGTN